MENLTVTLSNCYGISFFDETFTFTPKGPDIAQAYAIYAPNGLMKTSFARTFEALSKGKKPEEERFHRRSTCRVMVDGAELEPDQIYVLKSEIDIRSEGTAVSNILVNQTSKKRYDELVAEHSQIKTKLINTLQKQSGEKRNDIEKMLKEDFRTNDFIESIKIASEMEPDQNLSEFVYHEIFDSKAITLLESEEFVSKASEFNDRYQALFEGAGSIYKRGVFNPTKAETSFSTLKKQGYFQGGHRVHLNGDSDSIGEVDFQDRLNKTMQSIHSDAELNKIKEGISKNAQTQAIGALLERLTTSQLATLLNGVKRENQESFKQQLWASYVQSSEQGNLLLKAYEENREEIQQIETQAASEAPQWQEAIDKFNTRFLDMPFELSLFNKVDATLGKQEAKLKFIFKDGEDQISCGWEEIRALSQGEKRALYLLNFIFEVEDRKRQGKTTLFVIDDVADSFDYKNKYAIVQYLKELGREDNFYQIILTHNYDFFRTISNDFVFRPRCMMATRRKDSIGLAKAKGIKNYFVGEWKPRVFTDDIILCATVPFTRNIIQFTKGEDNPDFLRLTSLLHWKQDTANYTVGDYMEIYNRIFDEKYPEDRQQPFIDLLFEKATQITSETDQEGINLENKVLLSMAIRLQSEIYMTEKLCILKKDENYWCTAEGNQFGRLIKEFSASGSPIPNVLEEVSLTVSSNIHLNSFMYEPILDLTVDHLVSMYSRIKGLKV